MNFKAVELDELTGVPLAFSIFREREMVAMSTMVSTDLGPESKPSWEGNVKQTTYWHSVAGASSCRPSIKYWLVLLVCINIPS